MIKLTRILGSTLVTLGAVAAIAGCNSNPAPKPTTPTPPVTTPANPTPAPTTPTQTPASPQPAPTTPAPSTTPAPANPGAQADGPAVTVTAQPTSTAVVVNKAIMLPDGYKPPDLVEPNVPFIFTEKDEKRLMRQEAAKALEAMFAGAKKDGVLLAGVSGYRSFETQTSLFNYYVQTQGEETARKYSAEPGHSEHQTGLAMDVSGVDGKCAADDCFAGTPEANWLAAHAPEYGFIIRYPKGKEAITGYAYEPWHVRYLGKDLAQKVSASGKSLEEYLGTAH